MSLGTVGFVELPNDVRELINNYRPSPNGPAVSLGGEAIEVVRLAVRLVGAESKKQASLLLTHTARHVALAVQRGVALETMALFSPLEVQRSIDAVAAGTGQVSPFSSNLRRAARAAASSAGHQTVLRVKGSDILAPYSRLERVQLEAIAGGMNVATAASYRRGLALAFGARRRPPQLRSIATCRPQRRSD